jgi:hypothetical protein
MNGYDGGMAEHERRGVSIQGQSIKGQPRRLTVIPGQPGMVALTILVGSTEKEYTVVVPAQLLREALNAAGR